MSGKQEVETLELDNSEFHQINMKSDWLIQGIQEAEEAGECILICEDDADSVLVFFQINTLKPGQEDFQAMDSRVADNRREGTSDGDGITRYKSLMIYQESLGAYKQLGIAIRKSGSIDFYYDYRLVETSEAKEGEREYTAVDIDFFNIHFKCYELEQETKPGAKPERKLFEYTCATSWK